MKEADYYEKSINNTVICKLCPNRCVIKEGYTGICRVRKNFGGKLYTTVYGKVSALNLDPIEKKPFYHFFPGGEILTLGSYGCNLSCTYCQNYHISQQSGENADYLEMSIDDIAEKCKLIKGNIGIAFSYNEPTVFFEYMRDIAKKVKAAGMKAVMITNGYIEEKPFKDSFEFIDAYSIDLKGFKEDFYKEICGGKLEPVKKTIVAAVKEGKHIEIENLVIPEKERNYVEFEEMCKWLVLNCGKDIPLHINRYYPAYKMSEPPVEIEILEKLREIAKSYLNYVYIGNISSTIYSKTVCPVCGMESILRPGYDAIINGCNSEGKCMACNKKIFINN